MSRSRREDSYDARFVGLNRFRSLEGKGLRRRQDSSEFSISKSDLPVPLLSLEAARSIAGR